MHITDPGGGILPDHCVANRVHEVRFAKPDTAVNKQGVIGFSGILAHLAGGRPRELVALALHEVLEREQRVKTRDHWRMTARLYRHRGRPCTFSGRRSGGARPDLDNYFGIRATVINKL